MQICSQWLRRSTNLFYTPPAIRFVRSRYALYSSSRQLWLQGRQASHYVEAKHGLRARYRQEGATPVLASALPSLSQRDDPSAWVAILDAALPPRLRQNTDHVLVDGNKASAPDSPLSARDIASVVNYARRVHGHDILSHVALEEGRWKSVVWLVTHLVDTLWKGNPSDTPKIPSGPWARVTSLDMITEDHIELSQDEIGVTATPRPGHDLEGLTGRLHAFAKGSEVRLGHDVLGEIWHSLGNMILVDAARSASVTPEILEIIALLHHRGIMPDSIYTYAPSPDDTALRQPPTLHLLSSHILTSLSDAVWRAHEKHIVEEARASGSLYKSQRPEIPGSMYQVRVGGLGHEVWLELVLWSCLHGGWATYGAGILDATAKQDGDNTWSVLSWRQTVSPMVRAGQGRAIDWNEVRYLFSSGTGYGDNDARSGHRARVKKTVSSEVVAAYVDALIDSIRVGVGERGNSPVVVLDYIRILKMFLKKNDLNLESTSWDAVVLRLFESQGINLEADPGFADALVNDLSPPYGSEVSGANRPIHNDAWQATPSYVLDGTAATIGISHEILRAHIKKGNLAGAFQTLKALQLKTDENKRRSIEDFFRNVQSAATSNEAPGINFEGHYPGIDYPGFFPQIPTTVLAPFLQLVTNANELDFGASLLRQNDIDGPIIRRKLYRDPVMMPALIRFASATKDKELLQQLLSILRSTGTLHDGRLPRPTLQALLQVQVATRDWEAVQKTLDSFAGDLVTLLSPRSVSHLIRVMIQNAGPTGVRADVPRIVQLLAKIVQEGSSSSSPLQRSIDSQLVVVSCISQRWANVCWKLKFLHGTLVFNLDKDIFNDILKGVVDAYGSEAGKQLLAVFWKPAHADFEDGFGLDIHPSPSERANAGVPRMPTKRPEQFASPSRHAVKMLLVTEKEQKLRVRGRFRPNALTIRIIFQKFRDEQSAGHRSTVALNSSDARNEVWWKSAMPQQQSGRDLSLQHPLVRWAIRNLRHLGLADTDIEHELQLDVSAGSVSEEKEMARHISL